MELNLQQLITHVRKDSGVQSKLALQPVLDRFSDSQPNGDAFHPNGDDAAVIATESGFNLFAMEGFIPEFVAHDPWFAGWCGVMVNCSDIAAMGGKPVAVTNAIWAQNDASLTLLMQGIADAAAAYGVPVVGGHTCQNTASDQLSVAIVGQAQQVLSSFAAKPGDVLLCAVDLRGQYQAPFLNWNAATTAPPGQLQQDIALLPEIAAMAGVTGAKDISQAGLLGTATMFMDCSRCGVDIQLQAIPKPTAVSWEDWLCSFPSFGYLISCEPHCVEAVLALFQQRDIHAAVIGEINDSSSVAVSYQQQQTEFWNLAQQAYLVPESGRDLDSRSADSHSSDRPLSKIHEYDNKEHSYA
ncbi:sll0787 family AIR synthase-like protein [Bacterioplanoides sp.]|uniref:sll0787 family AIR synthase-like protein n=1 Tax=Bacterioplanoides sp. TaxID=2066072 RepID=UPI003B002C39